MSTVSLCLLLILSVCILVNGQDRECYRTLSEISGKCPTNCIGLDFRSRCYVCKENCAKNSSRDNACDPSRESSCGSDQVCLATGLTGQNRCVNRIREGELCRRSSEIDDDVDFGDLKEKIDLTIGIFERDVINAVQEAVIPCRKDLVCRKEALEKYYCRQANQTECFRDRIANSETSCDDEGNFEPLQCRRMERSDNIRCYCVSRNGTGIEGTERTVRSRSEAPDCKSRRCSYVSRLGNIYQASSGTNFIDYQKCALCLCAAGEPLLCVNQRSDVCNQLNPEPKQDRACSINNRRVSDGDSISIGCSRCRCNNGQIQCLKRLCEDEKEEDPVDEEDRKCQACRNLAVSPVCGSDGKTYPSECVATNCRELNTTDITPGPCNRKDVCQAYQCNTTEICYRKGGVTCLSRSGCRNVQRFRSCIHVEELQCRSNVSGEAAVCGSDGNTYNSSCDLLQRAVGIRALYGNRCDAPQCAGGQVCGTDGVTYSNRCELDAQSANARIEYRGECMDTPPGLIERERCQRIRQSGKCPDLSDCSTIIRPDEGCCLICGGGVTIGFNREALEDFLTINEAVQTVDDLMVRIFLSGFISGEDRNRCEVKGSLTNEGNLFISFESKQKSDSYCLTLARRIENAINNPPMGNSSISTSLPQELQFATVAVPSAIEAQDPTSASGEQAVKRGISAVVILASLLLISLFV